MHDWKPEHLVPEEYVYDSPDLSKKGMHMRLTLHINGKKEVDLSTQHHEFEPGMIAFISKPGENGFRVLKLKPAPHGAIINGEIPALPAGWMLEALGIK